MQTKFLQEGLRSEVEGFDRVVEAGEHVDPPVALIQCQPGRTAASGDVVRAFHGGVEIRLEGWILQAGGAENADLSRTEGSGVGRKAILGDHRLERGREAVVDLGRIHEVGHVGVELRVVDMLVQVLGINAEARRIDDRDARLREVALNRAATMIAGPFADPTASTSMRKVS